MSVNSKHIATFLLGAAAALAVQKYMTMTDDEKAKLASDIKDKANTLKNEAEAFAEKAKDYFEELKVKGSEALKEHMGEAENVFKDLFNKKEETVV